MQDYMYFPMETKRASPTGSLFPDGEKRAFISEVLFSDEKNESFHTRATSFLKKRALFERFYFTTTGSLFHDERLCFLIRNRGISLRGRFFLIATAELWI